MTKRAILVLALLVPAIVRADDMFRWRDARGRLHYSNDTERTPAGATPLTNQLGVIGGAPIGPAIEAAPPAEGQQVARPRPIEWPAPASCVHNLGLWALPHRSVDLDRWWWYDVDATCGPQRDIEGWLRRAATQLEFRQIGLDL